MRKLLKRSILFLLPVVVIGIIMEYMIRSIPNDYRLKKTYLEKNSGRIEVLSLGNSHAYYGINPSKFGNKTFNAAYVSQSLNWDLNILERYNTKLNKLKVVLIPVSYGSLFGKMEVSAESWRIKNYVLYYGFSAGFNIKSRSEVLSSSFAVNLKRITNFYRNNENPISCDSLGFGSKKSLNGKIDLKQSGKIAAKRHTKKKFTLKGENIESLEKIIAIASQKKAFVILYTPPAYASYIRHLNEKQLQVMQETVTGLDKRHENVIYVNYLNSDIFTANDFFDGDHVNNAGAEKLSVDLNSRIKSILDAEK